MFTHVLAIAVNDLEINSLIFAARSLLWTRKFQ